MKETFKYSLVLLLFLYSYHCQYEEKLFKTTSKLIQLWKKESPFYMKIIILLSHTKKLLVINI